MSSWEAAPSTIAVISSSVSVKFPARLRAYDIPKMTSLQPFFKPFSVPTPNDPWTMIQSQNPSLLLLLITSCLSITIGKPASQEPLASDISTTSDDNISQDIFNELEELSRIVDISYCVGVAGTGIQKPFLCASRCQDFPHFELVTTWNTGPFMSDSCGYLALSHPPSPPRIILAFRGTYSVANTIVDLSSIPQEYIPYPGDEEGNEGKEDKALRKLAMNPKHTKCTDCKVHAGFMQSWRNTRPQLLHQVKEAIQKYPDYQVTLVGHSLGGAVAALAALDFELRGWEPQVTTFGEPKIGNVGLVQYIDETFSDSNGTNMTGRYRRVTHVGDPVPLLPLKEWGYRTHAGELYISKPDLSPELEDIRYCNGDEDPECIAGAETVQEIPSPLDVEQDAEIAGFKDWWRKTKGLLAVPPRFQIWQLFFAHRDYFWRLGLCLPKGISRDGYQDNPLHGARESWEL